MIFFISFLLLFLSFKRKDSLVLLSIVLLLFLFSRGYKESLFITSSTFSTDGYYAKILSEPVGRGNRKKGYKAKIVASQDDKGDVFSSSGIVYVISRESDAHIFDTVYLKGSIEDDNLLFATSTSIIKEAPFSPLRNKMLELIRMRLRSNREGELSLLLLLGQGDGVDKTLQDLSTKAGLRHVIALSGMHLVVLSFLFEIPLKVIFKKSHKKIILLFLLLFVWLSGWRPSLFRAFLLRLFVLYFPLDISFLFSAIVSLLIFPHYSFDLGAIYSFSSLAGIMMLSNVIAKLFEYVMPNSVALYLSSSIAAQLFSVPISMNIFGSYQLSSILSSPIASFLVMIYMTLSVFELVIPIFMPLMKIIYKIIKLVFLFGSFSPMCETYKPYSFLVIITLSSIIISLREWQRQ